MAEYYCMSKYSSTSFLLNKRQVFGLFVNLSFLGQAFTLMLVYVWCRRNPHVQISIFGILTVQAPYLPWVLLAFSVLVGDSILVDALGKYLAFRATVNPFTLML